MSHYYSVLVITVVIINGLHCIYAVNWHEMLNDIVYFHSLTLSGLRAFLLKARGQYYEQETGARSPAIAKYSSHLKRNVFSFHPFEKPAWAHMYTHTEHTMYTSTHARTHTHTISNMHNSVSKCQTLSSLPYRRRIFWLHGVVPHSTHFPQGWVLKVKVIVILLPVKLFGLQIQLS